MKALRSSQIEEAKKAKKWGIVLGTLGRQGNELILERLKAVMKRRGVEYDVLLLSELSDAVVRDMQRMTGNDMRAHRITAEGFVDR